MKAEFLTCAALLAFLAHTVHGACTNPSAQEGSKEWNSTTSNYQFCINGSWQEASVSTTASGCTATRQWDYDSSIAGFKTCNGSAWIKHPCVGSTSETTIFITTGTTWTVPSDWNSNWNTIEVIGGGGAGEDITGGGGGGGAYALKRNLNLTPGSSIQIQVGSGGATSSAHGTDTFFNGASCAGASVCAKGGRGSTGTAGGAGGEQTGNTGSVGDVIYAGGNGGAGDASDSETGGGGGGAGGPHGPGGTGGDFPSDGSDDVGGGGGGGGGGTDGEDGAAPGGKGGNNWLGFGGGLGIDDDNGGAGSSGGGGGGGMENGGAGGAGIEWGSYGSGGGGGAGGYGDDADIGGAGGLYGGGGGGGGDESGSNGGAGANGIIVITYRPEGSTCLQPWACATAGMVEYSPSRGQMLYCDGSNWNLLSCQKEATSNAGYCWGYGNAGRLGNSETSNRTSPSMVAGSYTDWITISAATDHTCGVRNNGRAYCWGAAASGKLGDGQTASNRTSPALVLGGYTDWTDINAGGSGNSCGVRSNGTAYCWGAAASGKLGDGQTASNRTSPALVLGGFTDWASIATNNNHSCGLRRNGTLWCWGQASNGKLGDGQTATDRTTPTLVQGSFTDWKSISVGNTHACGIRGNGIAYCWGAGGSGHLGDDNGGSQATTPSLVAGDFNDWDQISAGYEHTCGIRKNGKAYCWGTATNGRLGDNQIAANRYSPSEVYGNYTDWTSINAGQTSTCGTRSNGNIYCWGYAQYGKLGDLQTTTDRVTPSLVKGNLTGWASASAGGSHACGIQGTINSCRTRY